MKERYVGKRWIVSAAGVLGLAGLALAQDGTPMEQGLTVRVYDIQRPMERLAALGADQTPNVDFKAERIDFASEQEMRGPADYFVVQALGAIEAKVAGRYEFRLTSDDGARMMVDGERIIDNDGIHAASGVEGGVDLSAGIHRFEIMMFENEGGAELRLEWKEPGAAAFEVVPADAFRIEKGVTRVVSPGRKTLLDGRESLKPGDGMQVEGVHPGWAVEDLRPKGFEPQVGGMDFLSDGRLVVSTFTPLNNGVFRTEPNGSLWALSGVIDGTPETITYERIAEGFQDPLGVKVVGGDIYVADRNEITRLQDKDENGSFESREVFASGWVSDNYHHFTLGLIEREGWLYATLSTSIYFENTIKEEGVVGEVVSFNGPNPAHRGTCFRVNLKTREVQYLAGGFRTPNGVGIGPEGEVFVTDNQGAWLPGSKLVHMVSGRFYGHYNGQSEQKSDRYPQGGVPALNSEKGVSPPAVWLPQNECANSPTQPIFIKEGVFDGQMYVGELTMGGIRRVFLERINGEFQGAVFHFTQGLECGVNRLIEGPDGCLYAGGTGADGNWSWRGTRFGLQRLRPTGAEVFEMHSISATPDGLVVRLTAPTTRTWLADATNYEVTQWRYVPTAEYGGEKHDVQRLRVALAAPSGDGKTVRLFIPGLRAGSVVHVRLGDAVSDLGEELWAHEAWYTLNQIPEGEVTVVEEAAVTQRADLNWFAKPTGDWMIGGDASMRGDDPTKLAAVAGAGVIVNGAEGRTSDLFTKFDHGDVRLHLEFKVPKGSNSGVYLMGRYEVQVLDSFGVADPQFSDCGGIYQRWDPARGEGKEGYEGHAPLVNAARPAGEWQTLDIEFRAPRFDDSGTKVANARFERVRLNGVVVQEGVEVTGPTRASHFGDEQPYGPLMLQGDHGPVAYRKVRLAALSW